MGKVTMLPRTAKLWKRWLLVAAVVCALLIGWSLFGNRAQPDLVTIRLVGLTNYSGGSHLIALFVITNLGSAALNVSDLVEVKSGREWPVYGPDMQMSWRSWPVLPSHQSALVPIGVPDWGNAWRVRIAYSKVFTKWDRTRETWFASLCAHRMHLVAKIIWNGKPCREIMTPEMKK